MFETVSRSWSLVKASAAVLRDDSELLWLPVISGIVSVIAAATFFFPALFSGVFTRGEPDLGFYLFGFLFYLVQYASIIYFNSALVGAAMIRLDGGDPTVGDGLRIAWQRLPSIVGYAAIAAVVGIVLRALESRRRNGFLVRAVVGALGAAWTVATFLVVPVLVVRNVGPIEAMKESVSLLKRSWGENLVGHVGLGAAFGLITGAVLLLGVGLVVLAGMAGGQAAAITVGAVMALALVLLAILQAALTGVYQAALYRYATGHGSSAAFDDATLAGAFRAG